VGGKSGATVANLTEHDLNVELLRIYKECGKFGYWPKRFYQMIAPHCERYVGGTAAVRKLLEVGGEASGLIRLIDENRLDLSIETLVLNPKWSHLFKPMGYQESPRKFAIRKGSSPRKSKSSH
jgi:hypothetical protein